jgi:O-antigen/teichoic acid export membrane protein
VKLVKDLAANNVSYVAQTLIRLLSTAIISRLVTPEEMGIWTLAFSIIGLMMIFRDFGTSSYIETTSVLEADDIRACNGIQYVLGAALFALFNLLARPIAGFYNEPRLANAIHLMTLSFLLIPLSSTIYSSFMRDSRIQLKSVIDLFAQFVFYSVVTLAAYAGMSYMSAPIGMIASQIVLISFALYYRRPDHPMTLSFRSAGKVTRSSSSALGVALLGFVSEKASDFILPKTQSFTQSALYEKGVNSADIVKQGVNQVIGTVLMSNLRTRTAENPGAFQRLAVQTISLLGLIATLGATILSFNAESFILILFGSQWVKSEAALRIIALALPAVCLSSYLVRILYFKDQYHTALRLALVSKIAVVAMIALLSYQRIEVIAMGVLIAELVFFAMNFYYTRSLLNWGADIGVLALDILVIFLIGFVSASLLEPHYIVGSLLRFVSGAALTTLLTLAYFLLLRRSRVEQIRQVLNI